jgi:hypothetical protein
MFAQSMSLAPTLCSIKSSLLFGGPAPIWKNIKLASRYWTRGDNILHKGSSKAHLLAACKAINKGIDDAMQKEKLTIKDVLARVPSFKSNHNKYKFL